MKRHKKPDSRSSTQSVRLPSEKALSHGYIPPDRATNPMIPWLHALAAMGDEHWEEAIVAFQRLLALEQDPEAHYLVWRNLSGCYHALERYDEALAALDETERSIPNNPDLVRSRGVIYACAGRLPEAIATFERFARRWPRQARLRDTRETIHELQRIQHGEIPPGSFLVRHLQEQIHHHIELGEFHLVERKARRMIAADPNRRSPLEWEIDDLSAKIKTVHGKLYGGRVNNPKELTGLQQEEQSFKATCSQREDLPSPCGSRG